MMKSAISTHNASGGVREMLTIALPMVVSSACDTVMVFTDRLFLSKLGMAQMNAVMVGGINMFFLMTFALGLAGYATAMIAQHFGAGERHKSPRVLTQVLIIMAAYYPLMLIVRPLMHSMFAASGITQAQLGHQLVYFDILVFAAPLPLARIALSNFFSGIGQTRVVMTASFATMLGNVGASYVLIFGLFGFPALGVAGAAYGSIIGSIIAVLILLAVYFSSGIRKEFSVMQA